MLKRYIVFTLDGYDAQGGWNDVLCETSDDHRRYPGAGDPLSFDTIEEAISAATPVVREELMSCDASFHVVDLHTGQIVA